MLFHQYINGGLFVFCSAALVQSFLAEGLNRFLIYSIYSSSITLFLNTVLFCPCNSNARLAAPSRQLNRTIFLSPCVSYESLLVNVLHALNRNLKDLQGSWLPPWNFGAVHIFLWNPSIRWRSRAGTSASCSSSTGTHGTFWSCTPKRSFFYFY